MPNFVSSKKGKIRQASRHYETDTIDQENL